MPTYQEGYICLSKEKSERFAWLVEHPDPEMIRRRDAFLAEIDRTIKAIPFQHGALLEIMEAKEHAAGDID